MLLKKAVEERCPECNTFKRELSPAQYGCDKCRTPIVPFGNDERLEVVVFHKRGEPEHYYFCSWRCVFQFVRKIKTDYFFNLPYVSTDRKIVGRRAVDFQREIRRGKR